MGRVPAKLFVRLIPFVILFLPSIVMANGMTEDTDTQESTYTIKEGDTLWDISSEKLKDPFLWKKIWEANPQIKNPDMIFPEQKINIPDFHAKQKDEEMAEQSKKASKAAPRDLMESGKIIIPTKLEPKNIPIKKKTYLTSRETLLRSGYISGEIKSSGKISSAPSGKELIGMGDYVYIDTEKPAAPQSRFYIISKSVEVIHPDTNKFIGHLYRVNGILEMTGDENGNQKAIIVESLAETTVGDLLSVFTTVELPVEPDKTRKPDISGVIIKIWNSQELAGMTDIIYLDKGADDGIAVGDIFNVITKIEPHTPVGKVQIINVKEKTSSGVIRSATAEILLGDFFKN